MTFENRNKLQATKISSNNKNGSAGGNKILYHLQIRGGKRLYMMHKEICSKAKRCKFFTSTMGNESSTWIIDLEPFKKKKKKEKRREARRNNVSYESIRPMNRLSPTGNFHRNHKISENKIVQHTSETNVCKWQSGKTPLQPPPIHKYRL